MEEYIWLPVLNGIKQLIPDVKLNLIEKIQLADAINIYLHLDRKDVDKSTGIITSRSYQPKDVMEERSVMLRPEARQQPDQPNLIPHEIPFSSGSHLIINQSSWWEAKPSNHVTIGNQLKICPIIMGEPIFIETLSKERELTVELNDQNQLTVKLDWAGEQFTVDCSGLSGPHTESAANSEWTLEKYSPAQTVWVQEEALSQFIFSFDQNIVKEAILIKRERIFKRKIHRNEYYILVLKVS